MYKTHFDLHGFTRTFMKESLFAGTLPKPKWLALRDIIFILLGRWIRSDFFWSYFKQSEVGPEFKSEFL